MQTALQWSATKKCKKDFLQSYRVSRFIDLDDIVTIVEILTHLGIRMLRAFIIFGARTGASATHQYRHQCRRSDQAEEFTSHKPLLII
jgi:hypothetical protein